MSVRRAPAAGPLVAPPRAPDIFRKVLRQQSYAAQLQLTLGRVTHKSPFRGEPISDVNPWLAEYRMKLDDKRSSGSNNVNVELQKELAEYQKQLAALKAELKLQSDAQLQAKIEELNAKVQEEQARADKLEAELAAEVEEHDETNNTLGYVQEQLKKSDAELEEIKKFLNEELESDAEKAAHEALEAINKQNKALADDVSKLENIRVSKLLEGVVQSDARANSFEKQKQFYTDKI